MHRRPRLILASALAALATGCAAPVDVEVAPQAADPLCAQVLVSLRSGAYDELAGRPRRDTTSQSTAAWGDPPVVLRCGVEPPGPTTAACVDVEGVDWVLDDARATFTTYGRVPAVEVAFPPGDVTGSDAVLVELSALVGRLPQSRECL
ncbi:MAG: DUF3515 family protein [Actinomycetota bacterium]